MIFSRHDLAVVPFPFIDVAVQKRRPALVLSSAGFNADHDAVIMAMITAARDSTWPSDVPLEDWADAGLSHPCLVRLKLFTLPFATIVRPLGRLSEKDRRNVDAAVSRALG